MVPLKVNVQLDLLNNPHVGRNKSLSVHKQSENEPTKLKIIHKTRRC